MRVLSAEESRSRARALAVAWRGGDDLSWREALRAQLAAEGVMTRRTLVERTLRWADAPRGDDARARLYELIDDLAAVGDLAVGEEGLVAATQPRAAVVHGSETVLFIGTAPTPLLERALGIRVEPRRLRRVVFPQPDGAALAAAMHAIGGKVIDAMRWAGLDRAPASIAAWWAELDARDALEEDAAREWSAAEVQRLALVDHRARWRDDGTGEGLLRQRMDGGWYRFALRRGGAVRPLSRDEATRTELALRIEAGALPPLVLRDEAGGVRFTLPARVPMAEYRLLLGAADRVEGATWEVSRMTWPALATVFRDRLEWAVDETALRGGSS